MERVLACPCQIEDENHKAGFIPQLSSPTKVYLLGSNVNVAAAQVQF